MRYVVEVLCPEISEALQKVAGANGYTWPNDEAIPAYTEAKYLYFYNKTLTHCSTLLRGYEQKTIEEMVELLQEHLKIGEWDVIIDNDTIKVGCRTFKKEDLDLFIGTKFWFSVSDESLSVVKVLLEERGYKLDTIIVPTCVRFDINEKTCGSAGPINFYEHAPEWSDYKRISFTRALLLILGKFVFNDVHFCYKNGVWYANDNVIPIEAIRGRIGI